MSVDIFDQTTTQLVRVECCKCHCIFAMSQNMNENYRRSHDWFYCPVGHTQHYSGESDLERAEKAAKRAQELLAQERERVAEARATAAHQERRARSLKGVVTMTKKRISQGKCPCCSKTFADLQSHMDERHPTYVEKA